ncbi:8-oxo-dGTP diphosphatase [Jatrophihabitans endophyticus]|uniref:8-oxo-dGTP diphosphatase n=1 Tax=Jatrophihabitans endophyticus TaxID=1206085 RepID=A0A1M5HYI6_9ACTN|nr:(deoxy)nucleoside triphosphate pyrophosphohydrolase [Jatrophihabitans endophyticus]SHG20967.1 8-oxo-dGTP diphosphatase [Jatrophihabitans endophyticus]
MIEVVAAALIRDARVLAARRAPPHRLAGGWEFPGGKVEPGESDGAALVRECREELDVTVEVDRRLGTARGDATVAPIRLSLYAARLVTGEPRPHEDHDALRWLTAAELASVEWLPIDRSLLPLVAAALRVPPSPLPDANRAGRL